MSAATAKREQWGSRAGFILAAVGSAVGLGNMWRFSYLVSEYGGAAFVVLYLLMTALVGLPVMLAEFMLGRGARKSPIQAVAHYGGRRWAPLGAIGVLSGLLILAYYSVIAGWTIRYALTGIFLGFGGESGPRFESYATGAGAIFFHAVFMAIVIGVVARGVQGGLERMNLILMPSLFAILVGLAIYSATLTGAGEGYAYYLQTDFREILSLGVLSQAAGQAFFSLSLGMGAMLTYASYLDRTHHLPNESLIIAGSDFLVAFVAGLVVFPLVFALGLQEEVSGSTVGALFITLPEAFAGGGLAGRIVGIFFFAALIVGALTSAMSIHEVCVSSAMDGLGWPRAGSSIAIGAGIWLIGIPAALSTDILGLMDQIAGNIFLVLGSLLLALFVGWMIEDPVSEVEAGAPGVRWFGLWRTLLRFVVPGILAIVLVYSVGDLFG